MLWVIWGRLAEVDRVPLRRVEKIKTLVEREQELAVLKEEEERREGHGSLHADDSYAPPSRSLT